MSLTSLGRYVSPSFDLELDAYCATYAYVYARDENKQGLKTPSLTDF